MDFLREALRMLIEGIMHVNDSAGICTVRGERSPDRMAYRRRPF